MKYNINDVVQGLCRDKAIITNIENKKYELLWEDGLISKIPTKIVDTFFKCLKNK